MLFAEAVGLKEAKYRQESYPTIGHVFCQPTGSQGLPTGIPEGRYRVMTGTPPKLSEPDEL
jgi:hypothetical protein